MTTPTMMLFVVTPSSHDVVVAVVATGSVAVTPAHVDAMAAEMALGSAVDVVDVSVARSAAPLPVTVYETVSAPASARAAGRAASRRDAGAYTVVPDASTMPVIFATTDEATRPAAADWSAAWIAAPDASCSFVPAVVV